MDFSSDSPIYLQIAAEVRARITDGDLGSGDQLMSTTQYATTYRINPATANKAFTALVQEGLVEKRRGIGMFVTEDAPEILRASGRARYLDEVLGPAIRRGLSLGLTPSTIRDHVETILEDS